MATWRGSVWLNSIWVCAMNSPLLFRIKAYPLSEFTVDLSMSCMWRRLVSKCSMAAFLPLTIIGVAFGSTQRFVSSEMIGSP